ncbi:MAG: hypothetical protein GWO44_22105, partial [Thermoplasmata archaeon]|nr:hypothetical protein [Thermoplasmata archaeon]NIY05876.1 hypothetical protein [Thermoplasmata archaeon]
MEEPMAGDMEYMSGEDDEDMGYLDYEYMGEPEPDEMEKYYMEEPDEEVPDEYSYMCRSGHPMEAERKPNR